MNNDTKQTSSFSQMLARHKDSPDLSKRPMCHFMPMNYEASDSDDLGYYDEWFECSYCGCVKDLCGKVIKND